MTGLARGATNQARSNLSLGKFDSYISSSSKRTFVRNSISTRTSLRTPAISILLNPSGKRKTLSLLDQKNAGVRQLGAPNDTLVPESTLVLAI